MPTHRQGNREREREGERSRKRVRESGRTQKRRQLARRGAAAAQSKCQNVITQQTNRNFSVHTQPAALTYTPIHTHTCTHTHTHTRRPIPTAEWKMEVKVDTQQAQNWAPSQMPAHLAEQTLEQARLLLPLLLPHSNCKALPPYPLLADSGRGGGRELGLSLKGLRV